MEKVEMVGIGIRPSLYMRLKDFPVTLQNRVVGKLNGRFKCQFATDTELKNDLLQAQQQEAIRKAKRDSQFHSGLKTGGLLSQSGRQKDQGKVAIPRKFMSSNENPIRMAKLLEEAKNDIVEVSSEGSLSSDDD
jgi:hypothetical protein